MIQCYISTSENKYLVPTPFIKESGNITIHIDKKQRFQEIDGFGASFTDSSAYLVNQILNKQQKKEVMEALFGREQGIGLSLLRNPMGASDYARSIYSYDDMPEGEEDLALEHFHVQHDQEDIIPLTRWAQQLNPALKVIASPWSAPGWMKDSGKVVTGQLLKRYYEVYATYFYRFIDAYQSEGIDIYAVTPQNEPLFVPENYPGMLLPAEEAVDFVKNYLRPTFETHGLHTKILGYDHNWDRVDYPLELLDKAYEAFDGVAWHWYGGKVISQSRVTHAFPDKEVHFTEGSGGEWIPAFEPAFSNLIRTGIDILRNYAKSFILWNIALDENNGPTVPGFGESTCRGLLEINQTKKEYEFTLDYFGLAHFSKWVEVGATRIASDETKEIKTVAFENSDASIVVILFNQTEKAQLVTMKIDQNEFTIDLPSKAASTCIFSKDDK